MKCIVNSNRNNQIYHISSKLRKHEQQILNFIFIDLVQKGKFQSQNYQKKTKETDTMVKLWRVANLLKQLYLEFIKKNLKLLSNPLLRRTKKVFQKMAKILRTRNAAQCRSHHQKTINKYKTVEEIANINFQTEFLSNQYMEECAPIYQNCYRQENDNQNIKEQNSVNGGLTNLQEQESNDLKLYECLNMDRNNLFGNFEIRQIDFNPIEPQLFQILLE